MSFPNTNWIWLGIASMNGDAAGRNALEDLCRLYEKPIFGCFRRCDVSFHDAQDLTQTLLAQLTHSRIWRQADPEQGRFRDYLQKIALNAFRNWRSHRNALRRGGGKVPESLDLLLDLDLAPAAPDKDNSLLFDRDWAWANAEAAFKLLEKQASRTPKTAARFDVLKRFLPGSWDKPSYAEAAAALGIPATSVGKIVERTRASFKLALEEVTRKTLGKKGEPKEEMAYLRRVLEETSKEQTAVK